MSDPAQKQASQGDMDHGFGHIEARLVVAHEPAPARHPAKSTFDHPTSRQHFEAWAFVGSAYDLQHEVPEQGFVEQLTLILVPLGG